MSHTIPARLRRAAVLTAAVAAGTLTTLSPAGAVIGDATGDGTYAYTAKLAIGDGLRSCTGALVDRNWVVTAAGCFSDDPARPQALAAGAPKWKTSATVGGKAFDVVELTPRTDRDLVLARLAAPVQGVAPLALATAAPAAGEKLRVPGYGRTKDEWVPGAMHTGVFGLDSVQSVGLAVTGTNGAAICKGDTGAPMVREIGGKAELVAVASRSWQGGCLGETETRTGASAERVDDLGTWVQQVRDAASAAGAAAQAGAAVYDPAKKTSTVFAVDADGHVVGSYNIDGQGWSTWMQIGDWQFAGSPTALYNPATGAVELFAIGRDGVLSRTYYLPDAQGWRPWATMGSTRFTGSPTAVYNPATRTAEVFATTTDGPVAHAYYTAGAGMTDWSRLSVINGWQFNGTPGAIYNPATGAIELFAIGRNSTMYHAYWFNDGKPWSEWLPLNGAAFTGSPSLVYNPATKTVEVFATTADGPVAHSYYTPGMTGWSAWANINGWQFNGTPGAIYNPATDAIELFATGRNNLMYHSYWFNDGKPWSAWEVIGDWQFNAGRIPAALFSPSSNTVDFFATGADGAMNHTSYKPGMSGWAPWNTLPGTTLLTN